MKAWFISVAIILLVGGLALISLGFYPVLRINGEWVLQKTVSERYDATTKVFEAQGVDDVAKEFEEKGSDFFLNVLEVLIDERLAWQEAAMLVDNVQEEVDRRVEEAMEEVDIESTVENVYGVSFESFRKQVLEPGAVIDILRDEIGAEALSGRLEEMRLTADVQTYFISYRWQEGVLVSKEE